MQGVNSLKEKRSVLHRLIDRASRESNVAIAEVGDHDLWGNAELGIAAVGNSLAHAEATLRFVLERLESDPDVELTVESSETVVL
jgi:uncharacterized protein YlxP (DUF503 family)